MLRLNEHDNGPVAVVAGKLVPRAPIRRGAHRGDGRSAQLAKIDTPTPESTQGDAATTFLRSKLQGRWVGVEQDPLGHDGFGRTFVYLWVGKRLVNASLAPRDYANVIDEGPGSRYDVTLLPAVGRYSFPDFSDPNLPRWREILHRATSLRELFRLGSGRGRIVWTVRRLQVRHWLP